jgi:hypothetical protein
MKKLNLNYETLKNSKFYMVIYKDSYGQFKINYVVNITKKAIKSIFDKWSCFELVTIKKITLNEYIQNNFSFSEIEHIQDDLFKVEFWQQHIFKIDGLFQFDKIFNVRFVEYELKGHEIKEIIDIQEKDKDYLKDLLSQDQQGLLDLIVSKNELELNEMLKVDNEIEFILMENSEKREQLIDEINKEIIELKDKGNYKYHILDEKSFLTSDIKYLENKKKEIIKYRMFINK